METSTQHPGRNIDDFLREQTQMTKERHEMLGALLSSAMIRRGYFLAFASWMGSTEGSGSSGSNRVPSYTVLHTLEWISQHVHLGSEMPFMADKIDPGSGRLIVDCSNADEVKQRAPDWTRQAALAAYLTQPQRKFGPLMGVISPSWVDDQTHENWCNGRALKTAAEFIPIEPNQTVGLLKLDGVRVYALDGQHRVLGMRGLRELRDLGFLQLRAKNGSPRSSQLSRDDFIREFGLTIEAFQSVFCDTMPVEYLPAVVRGESHAEATRRIRRTFIAINSYAKKTEKGENILLDETNGYAIVARRLAVNHPLFRGRRGQRVNWKTTSIPSGRTPFITTLNTLEEIARCYLPAVCPEVVDAWQASISGVVPMRPSDQALNEAFEALSDFFDRVGRLPIFARLAEQTAEQEQAFLEKWREFPRYLRTGAMMEGTSGFRGHLLLRPLGQIILTKAVVEILRGDDRKRQGLTLNTIFRRLNYLDDGDGFEAHRPRNIWWGVTYSGITNRILNSGASWGHKLLVQCISGIEDKSRKNELWWTWVRSRAVDLKSQTWKNLEGRVARFDWDTPELPEPIGG